MGLDTVELALEVEERFGISLPDEECQKVTTVDDLYQLVLSKLDKADPTKCLTSATFYRVRKGIADVIGVDKRTLKPDTPLQELLPLESRRDLWASISERLALNLPKLWRGPGWGRTLVGIPVLSLIVPLVFAAMDVLKIEESFTITLLGILATYGLAKVTQPLKKYFHPKSLTLGALTKTVLALNFSKLSADCKSWNEKDIYDSLLEVIEDNAGIKKEDIQPHHAFIDDLNMD